MTSRARFPHVLLGCAAFVLLASAAAADGVYVPPLVTDELPKIPNQRAVIVWRNGVEELIVQSDMSGTGDEVAWILPVPAEPTKVAPMGQGVFTTLRLALLPEAASDEFRNVGFFSRTFAALAIAAWGLFQILDRRWKPVRSLVHAVFFAFFVVNAIAMVNARYMTLGDSLGPDAGFADIQVREMGRAGNYVVQVLRPANAEALNRWLDDNGFRVLGDDGERIATDYIREGWVFVAARLERKGQRETRPHPLAVAFPAEKPVYPMRLTQLADSVVALDLYVISDTRANARDLDTVYCQKYRRIGSGERRACIGEPPVEPPSPYGWPVYGGKGIYPSPFRLGLPSLVDAMGAQGAITHLQGVLSPRQQKRDLAIGFEPYAPAWKEVWLWPNSFVKACQPALFVLGGLLTLLSAWRYCREKLGRPVRRIGGPVVSCFCLACAVALFSWHALPRGRVLLDYDTTFANLSAHAERTCKTLQAWPDLFAKMTRQEIEDYFAESFAGRENPWTGMPFEMGEGPGQFQIIEDDRGIVLRAFSDPTHWRAEPIEDEYGTFIGLPEDTVIRNPDGTVPRPDPPKDRDS